MVPRVFFRQQRDRWKWLENQMDSVHRRLRMIKSTEVSKSGRVLRSVGVGRPASKVKQRAVSEDARQKYLCNTKQVSKASICTIPYHHINHIPNIYISSSLPHYLPYIHPIPFQRLFSIIHNSRSPPLLSTTFQAQTTSTNYLTPPPPPPQAPTKQSDTSPPHSSHSSSHHQAQHSASSQSAS
jgi:hypothetical protein